MGIRSGRRRTGQHKPIGRDNPALEFRKKRKLGELSLAYMATILAAASSPLWF